MSNLPAPGAPSTPHPGVTARVDRLVAAFRNAHPGLPPAAELTAELDAITAGPAPLKDVLRELWMTALAASAQAATLAQQLDESRASGRSSSPD